LRKVDHIVHRGFNPPRWAIGSPILIISWLRSSEKLQRIALPRDSPAAIRRISGILYHVLLLIVLPSLLEDGFEKADSLHVRSTVLEIRSAVRDVCSAVRDVRSADHVKSV
jgi:hypothetical protein